VAIPSPVLKYWFCPYTLTRVVLQNMWSKLLLNRLNHCLKEEHNHDLLLSELAYTLEVNEKSDIYSFRVVALEVIMGRHPGDLISLLSLSFASSSTSVPHNVLLKEVLDQRLAHPTNKVANEVVLVAKLALSCLHASPQYRPTMQQVSQKLTTRKYTSPNPLDMVTLGDLNAPCNST
jgi:hypothetical protein